MNDKKFWLDETGAATAEYAIATMAAVPMCTGFAGQDRCGPLDVPTMK